MRLVAIETPQYKIETHSSGCDPVPFRQFVPVVGGVSSAEDGHGRFTLLPHGHVAGRGNRLFAEFTPAQDDAEAEREADRDDQRSELDEGRFHLLVTNRTPAKVQFGWRFSQDFSAC